MEDAFREMQDAEAALLARCHRVGVFYLQRALSLWERQTQPSLSAMWVGTV